MTTQLVNDEIQRFLSDDASGVLVISGKWGVGKTFAWNRFLSLAKTHGKIAFAHYAYVSLFGLGDLDDLRSAIFQNTVKRENIGEIASLETLESVVDAAPRLWRKAGVLSKLIPGVEKYSAAFEKVGFFWVKKQIICIDDLERKSSSLEMRDVLGLISHLKEQRACKVVLLLNDEKFQEDDDAEFRSQLEKVADITLRFEPTPVEAAAIGVDPNLPFADRFRTDCEALGIVNIRTIKMIERMAKRLFDELKPFDQRIFEQGLHTLALLIFAKMQPDEAPSLAYIKSLSSYDTIFQILAEEGQQPPEHAEWQALLSSYGFNQVDEFDSVIFRAVCEGHFDPGALTGEAEALQKTLQASDDDKSFQEAWDKYHDSFDDNAEEVTQALAESIQKTPNAISPTNLSGTISVLKDLNWAGDICALIDGYVAARGGEPRGYWDLASATFGGEVRDPDVREAFLAKLATFTEGKDPVDLLQELAKGRGWNPEDVTFLAGLTPDNFYDLFKTLRGSDLRRAIAGALHFRDVGNVDPDMAALTANAVAALERIGKESEINRRRVAQRGVAIQDAIPATPVVPIDEAVQPPA